MGRGGGTSEGDFVVKTTKTLIEMAPSQYLCSRNPSNFSQSIQMWFISACFFFPFVTRAAWASLLFALWGVYLSFLFKSDLLHCLLTKGQNVGKMMYTEEIGIWIFLHNIRWCTVSFVCHRRFLGEQYHPHHIEDGIELSKNNVWEKKMVVSLWIRTPNCLTEL